MNESRDIQREGVVQDEEVFLYKIYDVLSKPSRPKTLESLFIHYQIIKLFEEIENKTNTRKKSLSSLFKKYNLDTSRHGFSIEMFTGGLLHEFFFITLTLQEEIVIGPTKKPVIFYMVGDLVFLD